MTLQSNQLNSDVCPETPAYLFCAHPQEVGPGSFLVNCVGAPLSVDLGLDAAPSVLLGEPVGLIQGINHPRAKRLFNGASLLQGFSNRGSIGGGSGGGTTGVQGLRTSFVSLVHWM